MISYEKGAKHSKDRVVLFNGHKVTFREWTEVFLEFCRNEDKIYPMPRFLGRNMLVNFLMDCLRSDNITEEISSKYKIN